jgi:hypothetical protein
MIGIYRTHRHSKTIPGTYRTHRPSTSITGTYCTMSISGI